MSCLSYGRFSREGIRAALIPLAALLALFGLGALPAPFLGSARADPPVGGLIGERYNALGGSGGPLGRPTGNEEDAKEGNGRVQNFQHGVIGWTPSTGPKSTQALYIKDRELVFEWGDTAPFKYDLFLVRWDLNGKNVGQDEIKPGSRTGGKWTKPVGGGGKYRVVVEGGESGIGGTKFHQGWSNPLYLDFSSPGPDYVPYKPRVKEPQPVVANRPIKPPGSAGPMPQGLFLKEWMRLGGPAGPMGLPLTAEQPHAGGGKGGVVAFQNGQTCVSPDVWPNGVLAAYQDLDGIIVDWTVSWGEPNPPSPFQYGKFILRWDQKGQNGQPDKNIGQIDVNADGSSNDSQHKVPVPDTHLHTRGTFRLQGGQLAGHGHYSINVEGANSHGLTKTTAPQGWMKPVVVNLVGSAESAKLNPLDSIDLTKCPPAKSVADAKARFDQRTAAAILYCACQPLPHTDYRQEESFGPAALARLAYADYFQSEKMPGRNYAARDEAIEALRRQQVGSKAGTSVDMGPIHRTGEYDVAMSYLAAIVYKYYHVLPPDVQDHIIDELLDKRGPFEAADLVVLGSPETENHLNGIETARYLTNQLLLLRGGDPQKYDNSRNGMDEWMLKRLQNFLKTDFIEYNARPYQDYTLRALLNLYSFTSAHHPSGARVKMAAQMVLDYLMAKAAVSTNDARRSATYRRKSSYYTPSFVTAHFDPMTAFLMTFAGTTETVAAPLPGSYGVGMLWAGLSDYRIPDPILDLMIDRPHRTFFQRFHHYADEAYAGSPSYLISSGGHYATFAYRAAGGLAHHDDIGYALPTTLMPTGQFRSCDELIRFAGAKDDDKRSNMGVAPDFACGLNPVVPAIYKRVAGLASSSSLLKGYVEEGPWSFIDQSTPALRNASGGGDTYTSAGFGYYVAVYQRDGFGFLEAHDTAHNPGLKFKDFKDKIQQQNAGVTFKKNGHNTYTMSDGRKVVFEIAPDSSVIRAQADKPFFLSGDIMNSALGSGIVTISNPSLKKQIVLDFRDWHAPKRTEH